MKKFKLFLFAAMLLGSVGLHASNTITYTATAQLPGYDGSLDVGKHTFGSVITSHEFSNGTGVITCNGEITMIGNSAFRSCTGLISIEIPNSVYTIERHAFYDCTGLTSVTVCWKGELPPSIDHDVFDRIANREGPSGATLYVLNGTKEYYQQADEWKDFGNIVEYINTITYTASAKLPGISGSLEVGKTTFGPAITSHEFSNGTGTITCAGKITKIGNSAFNSCTGLISIEIPNTVTEIGEAAFYGCTGLTSVEIPNSVDSIRRYAFQGCTGLTSIEIPSSVTKIRGNAFWECSGLTSVTVSWTDSESIAPIESSSFGRIANGAGRSGATLHVPNGTAALYQQADEWKVFGRIECDLIKVNNLWYRPLNVRTVNLIVNQDTTATGERIPYSGDVVIPNTIIYNGNNSISAIEDSVFYNAKLTSLTVLTDIPLPCEQYTFLGQDKSIPVYVLDVDAFKRAQYWNKFTNIQFYAPYRDEAKQKLIDAANSVSEEHKAEAKAIAEAYGKKMDGLNTAAAIDKLYAQALEEIQAFMDEALWTLDKTGCMTLPKP